jgi:hypothetical protein
MMCVAVVALLLPLSGRAMDLKAPPTDAATAHEVMAADVPPSLAGQLLAGAGAAAFALPGTLALTTWMGTGSNQLLTAALPSLILLFALPPIAVNGVVWYASNLGRTGSNYRFWPSFWATLATHALVTVGAIMLGANATSPGSIAPYLLVDAALMPAASAGTMRWMGPTAPAPRASNTVTVPLVSLRW